MSNERIRELEATVAMAREAEARMKLQRDHAELAKDHIGQALTHYMDSWVRAKKGLDALKGELRKAADTLEAEGLTRSAEAAREAALAAGR